MNRKSSIAVEWQPLARKDLLDAYIYLVETRGTEIAEDTVFRMQDVGNKLRVHPLLWREREQLYGVRLAPVHPYYVCYRMERNLVQILRVVHHARDLAAILNVKPV